MLKIRDDIDLKELEKFEFEYEKLKYGDRYILRKKIDGIHTYLIVSGSHREVCGDCLDTVYELMQADLIEKVSE